MSNFSVILLTIKQINYLTNADENINPLAEVTNRNKLTKSSSTRNQRVQQ